MSKPTALYRLYNAHDQLLYVGITNNPEVRFATHARQKPWWPDVHRHSIEWIDSREEAERAEAVAIGREAPRWNVVRPDENGKMHHGGLGGRPTGRTTRRNVRVDASIWNTARQKAAAEGRTVSDVILAALRRYVASPPREHRTDD